MPGLRDSKRFCFGEIYKEYMNVHRFVLPRSINCKQTYEPYSIDLHDALSKLFNTACMNLRTTNWVLKLI